MNYSTIEAYMEKTKIVFPENFRSPKGKVRVLVTFIEEKEENNILVN